MLKTLDKSLSELFYLLYYYTMGETNNPENIVEVLGSLKGVLDRVKILVENNPESSDLPVAFSHLSLSVGYLANALLNLPNLCIPSDHIITLQKEQIVAEDKEVLRFVNGNTVYKAFLVGPGNLNRLLIESFSFIDKSLMKWVKNWKPRRAQPLLLPYFCSEKCKFGLECKENVGFTTAALLAIVTKLLEASRRREASLGVAIVQEQKINQIKRWLNVREFPFSVGIVENEWNVPPSFLMQQFIVCTRDTLPFLKPQFSARNINHLAVDELHLLPNEIYEYIDVNKLSDFIYRYEKNKLAFISIQEYCLRVELKSQKRKWVTLRTEPEFSFLLLLRKRFTKSRVVFCGFSKQTIKCEELGTFKHVRNIEEVSQNVECLVWCDPLRSITVPELLEKTSNIFAKEIYILSVSNPDPYTILREEIFKLHNEG
ncbi:hypothetical protein LSM04_001788 [Trypanosoma melophagium]|uniref:uncharacterized protein n=1 Tax=Trypanosoma melophagium TaxID=715481 RepID=UPI003519EFF4|nr:hypothetical protein LSM04_001788 [Trypanosoma melophagium]